MPVLGSLAASTYGLSGHGAWRTALLPSGYVASTFSDDARRLRNPKAILSALSGFASSATRMSSHMRSNSEEGELMMLDSRALWAGISEQVVCSDMDVPSEEACFNRNKSPRPTPPPHRTNVRRQCGRVMQDLSDFRAVT